MCRITGFLDFKGSRSGMENIIASMRDTMTSGGPDDAGLYCDVKVGIALGHRRLSILDLSVKGRQPMCNEDESLWIAYNGEVYNFCEIRDELAQNGHKFISQSDTEVILKAYEQWGINAVHKFRGMWAFAVWDKRSETLVLCRDRVGVKPLYWYYKDGLFMFASELKAFHKHPRFQKELDMAALSLYFQYGYITSPYSIFQYARKLEPGHYLTIDKKENIKTEKYWDAGNYYMQGSREREEWLKRSDYEVADELETILTESFKLRMVSDVPVGMFLSGGVDSSLVTALLQKEYSTPLRTFTIGFNERDYNEAVWAKQVAAHLGTDHTELYCTPNDAFDIIPKLPELYDEPFGDSSAVPTYLLSNLTRQHVKVSLSADGGDELFCGYSKYSALGSSLKRIKTVPFAGLLSKIVMSINPDTASHIYDNLKIALPKWTNFREKYIKLQNVIGSRNELEQIDMASKFYMSEELRELGLNETMDHKFKANNSELDLMAKMMLLDIKSYMPDDILVKVDRATMGVALEGREPLLDNRIIEYASRMPVEFKYRAGSSKHILRKILYKYVPQKLIDRPKQGFGIPVYDWLKKELTPLFREYLSYDRVRQERILNPEFVKNMLGAYLDNKGVSAHKLWFLLMFQMWRERWAN
ncbi:MAG: asparagine synthase (glutamine-hydrolyzing) [Nitrospirae bacterium]|nr:MAG: asparagine synthase (glutamine-hydrolyzing) [Nitrospirota bacterium]